MGERIEEIKERYEKALDSDNFGVPSRMYWLQKMIHEEDIPYLLQRVEELEEKLARKYRNSGKEETLDAGSI